MSSIVEFAPGTDHAQAANTLLYLQFGTLGIYIGRASGYAARLEVCTPNHWFRVRSYRKG